MRRIAVLGAAFLVAFLAFTPLAAAAVGTLDQSQTNTSEDGWVWGTAYVHAQTFTAGLSGTLSAVSLYLDVEGADGTIPQPGSDVTVGIWATDGNGMPTGSALASETLRATSSGAWNEIDFSSPTSVAAGTVYAISAQSAQSLYLNWATDCDENYAPGRALIYDQNYDPTVWQTLVSWSSQHKSPVCGRDHAFRTYVVVSAATPAPTATPAATVTPAPTATTPAATVTPAESIEGQTATPVITLPPTSTGGNGSSNDSGPTFAVLLCLTAAGLGLAAARSQRSNIRKDADRN